MVEGRKLDKDYISQNVYHVFAFVVNSHDEYNSVIRDLFSGLVDFGQENFDLMDFFTMETWENAHAMVVDKTHMFRHKISLHLLPVSDSPEWEEVIIEIPFNLHFTEKYPAL